MRPLLAFVLAASAPAWAADHEISFDLGTMVAPDDAFAVFDEDGAMFQFGGRGAFAIDEHFAIDAGYAYARSGNRLFFDDEVAAGTTPVAAFFANEISAGGRFDWPLWGFFVPYARVDGLFLIADARFDDDPNDPDSPGQRRQFGFSGGARGMGGIDFQLPHPQGGLSGGLYIEAGYSWLSPTKLDTIGDVHLYGFTVRSGIGLRL